MKCDRLLLQSVAGITKCEDYASPFIYDRNFHGGSIPHFIREDISTKTINTTPSKDFKWFSRDWTYVNNTTLSCFHDPHDINTSIHIKSSGNQIAVRQNLQTIWNQKWENFKKRIICIMWSMISHNFIFYYQLIAPLNFEWQNEP